MAAYNLEEQETIDELKAWWKEYGTLVLLSAAAFAIAAGSIQGWRYYKKNQAEQAGQAYMAFQETAAARDAKKIRDAAAVIIGKYSATPYASRAALTAAHASAEAGDLQSAKLHLQWVLDHAREAELADAARLRLAGMLLDERKLDEALKLMEARHGESFESLYQDLRGDILAAQGKATEAKGAYQKALQALDKNSAAYRALIQAKADGFGEAQ